jgi:serine/threonine-protein kinase PpkA
MQIPGYKIERLIAEGGMASVYLAVQESLDRPVALKLLRKFDSPAQALRFFNEGKIIASFNHRNIITIYDLGVVGERHYLAMEYLQGGDLRARINAGMDAEAALGLLETLSLCLGFVHRKGIIHRDIKPENILFRKDGTVVLTDFGVAKLLESDASLTMDGTTLGSPHYLSPEQAESKPLDGRADIYSLGIVFYEMLTGLKPFHGDSAIEIIVAHLTREIPALPPHLQDYQDLLARMTAKDPAERFASVEALADCIQTVRAAAPQHLPTKVSAPMANREPPVHANLIREHRLNIPHTIVIGQPKSYQRAVLAGLFILSLAAVALIFWPAAKRLPQPALAAVSPSPAETPLVARKKSPPREHNPLREAAAVLNDKPLTLPKLKQAYDYYQVILKKQPRHPEALRGVNIIARQFVAIRVKTGNYLDSAKTAVNDGRLIEPENYSAVAYYRQILALDPEHPEALQGIAAIADVFAERAATHLSKSETAAAVNDVQLGLSVQADHSGLLALAAKLKSADENDNPPGLLERIRATFPSRQATQIHE